MYGRIFAVCLALGSFAPVAGFGVATGQDPAAPDLAQQQIASLREDIRYLSSEALRGRSVADETIDIAADYIAGRMKEIGLDVAAVDGNAFQPVAISLGARAGAEESNRVVIKLTENDRAGADRTWVAKLDEAMNPMAIGSSRGQLTGPLVFVGYGITAPRLGYDDYAGINARGATVIVLRKEPQAADPNSVFNGKQNTRHAFFATKIRNAIDHGASAVILVNDRASIAQNIQEQTNRIAAEMDRKETIKQQIMDLPSEATNNRKTLSKKIEGIDRLVKSMRDDLQRTERGILGIADAGNIDPVLGDAAVPVVSVARDLIDELMVAATGQSLTQLEMAIDQTTRPQSHPLPGVTATLGVELQPTTRSSPNVIGVLPGRGDLKEQSVIVGAHYDHVGMGDVGSLAPGTIAVHNGADDNASGTATMLATAAQMVRRLASIDSHRRVVFIAFTGEERGLLGSQYYVRHPRFPLESTAAMINLDMVGRLRDNELTVYGTGSGDLLDQIVEGANRETRFDLFKVATGYGPSDHQSFYEVGVPVLFFFTGLHNDYHRPSDDFDKIDFNGTTRITDITSNSTFELAIRRERPSYAVTEKSVQIRRQMTTFLGVTLSDRGDQVAISGLTPGGPAERVGIRVGDRITTIAGKAILQSSDVLEQLRGRSPGDEISIEVIRDGRVILLRPQLVARP